MAMYRQGDVLIRSVAKLPKGAQKSPDPGRIVLALGEATGHAHAIAEGEADSYSLAKAFRQSRRFLLVPQNAAVRHEEHLPVHLLSGVYEVVQQRVFGLWDKTMVAAD